MSSEHAHGHAHGHGQHDDTDIMSRYTPEYWDDRYRSTDRLWSGHVNSNLASTASELSPGTALDVGCGEGGDAIWLAEHGWTVTAIDVSVVALDRAAAQAARVGDDIAGRITWQQADILAWDPSPQRYDLVSAQFIHLPQPNLEALHHRLAAAVRPGGTLLIVGHHPSDLETSIGRQRLGGIMYTAEQMAVVLDPSEWDITTTAPGRETTDPDGHKIMIQDAVVRAIRK
jgi:2-polyprenyl-3-methyl-5-hydroxy-6-metoxy-1,4-benzoquinol methylase